MTEGGGCPVVGWYSPHIAVQRIRKLRTVRREAMDSALDSVDSSATATSYPTVSCQPTRFAPALVGDVAFPSRYVSVIR